MPLEGVSTTSGEKLVSRKCLSKVIENTFWSLLTLYLQSRFDSLLGHFTLFWGSSVLKW